MRQRFSTWIPFLLLGMLAIYVATVEMRPGRLYFLLNYLLFQDSLVNFFLYLAVFGFSILSLLLLWLNRNKVIFAAFLVLLFPCLFISLAYRLITGYNFMYSDAVLAWNNLALASSVLSNYSIYLLIALAGALFIPFLLAKIRKKIKWRFRPYTALVLPIVAIAAYTFIQKSTGVVDDFPALYRVPLTLTTAISDRVPQPERAQVTIQPVTRGVPHLYLIIDESITATELTLNNAALATTPYLASIQEQITNFGVSRAYTNQSGGSNLALFSGARASDLPDKDFALLTRSNIFQFAKKAGYTTYYIDAQLGGDGLQNFMSPEDLKYIDHIDRPANTQGPYYERDMLVAQRLTQLSKQPTKVFVYVVKAGAHWPYGQTYPPDSTFFSPALASRSFYKDPERTLNTYHNALRWTVDEFWRKLMHGISAQDSTVIIYTSDHGQNLTKAGISLTHASVHETSPQEAAVPLWIWDPAKLVPSTPANALITSTIFSHAHIFPSLLQLQGYSPDWVKETYGSSLLDSLPQNAGPNVFLAGDIFGRGPHSLLEFYPSKALLKK